MRIAIPDTSRADTTTTMMMTVMTEGAVTTADTDPLPDRKVEALHPAARAALHLRIKGVVRLPLAHAKGHDRHTVPAMNHVRTEMIEITPVAHPRPDIANPGESPERREKFRTDETVTMTPRLD